MGEATPRINAPYLDQFTHQTVRIVGKVTQLRGEQATIDANGPVTVHLNREAHLTLNNAVELIGKVQNDLSLKALVATDFGPNLDMAVANDVVDVTLRYPNLFYDKET